MRTAVGRHWAPTRRRCATSSPERRARAACTPLIWAAATGRLQAADWLLDHGADPNRRGTFGCPAHGEGVTALHLAAQNDRAEMVSLLLRRGADPRIEDARYQSTLRGWAEHGDAREAAAVLRDRAERSTPG